MLPILDDLIQSCRLMPVFIQTIFMFFLMGLCTVMIPLVFTSALFYIVVISQAIVVILLIQKNIVYRRISNLDYAIKKKVIWVHTKRDESGLKKKRVVNLLLVLMTVFIYFQTTDSKILIINGLFCFLYSLKLFFYVPTINIRIVETAVNELHITDQLNREVFQFPEISTEKLKINMEMITVNSDEESTEIKFDFISKQEMNRMVEFLTKLGLFEVEGAI